MVNKCRVQEFIQEQLGVLAREQKAQAKLIISPLAAFGDNAVSSVEAFSSLHFE